MDHLRSMNRRWAVLIGIVAITAAVALGIVTRGIHRAPPVEVSYGPVTTGAIVREVMTTAPKVATCGELGSAAVYRMERHGIMAMPVVDENRRVHGVVHLHDLMRAGVA